MTWSLWAAACAAGSISTRFLSGSHASATLSDLTRGSILGGQSEKLRGRSVLVATTDQFSAALVFLELDGIAGRLILCPPDLPVEHLPYVIAVAQADVIVSDRTDLKVDAPSGPVIMCSATIEPADCDRSPSHQTEWVLLTSGTTGRPKMVLHTLSSLSGAIGKGTEAASPIVWSTFYDIRRYGGLQIFLRAILTRASLVLSSAEEPTADFLTRAGTNKVTHISGTPSHWRRALMSPSANKLSPQYIRLSGEIADQSILDHLQHFYPGSVVAHAFASTEAGVAFDVRDGLAGFPATFIGPRSGDVEMKVEDGSLRIRSLRTAVRYLGQDELLADADGFVDTTDIVELRGDRYHFVGRRDGVINVGGMKVHPEEIETVINRHPRVRISLVRTRKNPIMGALVVADVVLNTGVVLNTDVVLKNEAAAEDGTAGMLRGEILQLCREALPRHKVPAAIRFVPSLAVAATGKLERSDG